MCTYNGLPIPEMIRTSRIISAFQNDVSKDMVDEYADMITNSQQILPHCIPPITGYPSVVTMDDVDNEQYFLDGNPVQENLIGEIVWFVTDGHHRSLAAIQAGLPYLTTMMDTTCFTNADELEAYRQEMRKNI